jgi:hypothetical protein
MPVKVEEAGPVGEDAVTGAEAEEEEHWSRQLTSRRK